jgi:hypothetical protein
MALVPSYDSLNQRLRIVAASALASQTPVILLHSPPSRTARHSRVLVLRNNCSSWYAFELHIGLSRPGGYDATRLAPPALISGQPFLAAYEILLASDTRMGIGQCSARIGERYSGGIAGTLVVFRRACHFLATTAS